MLYIHAYQVVQERPRQKTPQTVMTNYKNWMTYEAYRDNTGLCREAESHISEHWRPRPQYGAVGGSIPCSCFSCESLSIQLLQQPGKGYKDMNYCTLCPFSSGWRCVFPDFFNVSGLHTLITEISLPFIMTFILKAHLNAAASTRLLEQNQLVLL